MLPALENVPRSASDWLFFAWHHRDSHDRIRDAIKKKYGIDLTDYQVEPISPDDTSGFLQNNSSLHGDMNGMLKLQSADLQDVDFKNEKEVQGWILLHYQEHVNAEQALGI
jgi:hypothetical protein